MASPIRAAFCGSGSIVRSRHLPDMQDRPDRFEVAGFYDIDPSRAAALAGSRHTCYPSYEALLEDGSVELVVVATKPLETHFPAARQALEAGKHVLLEKPMASTSAQCDELIALARRRNVVLTVHHNRRLNLDFLALQDVLRRGKIGEPRLIENRIGSGAYGGGDCVDWGIHLVDQCLLLNASPLQEVSALFCNPDGAPHNAGFGEATFRFAEPPLVRRARRPRATEYLQNGTRAGARFYAAGTAGAFLQRVIESPEDLMNATQNFDRSKPDYGVPEYLSITRKDYYDYLWETLREKAPLLVTPESARNAIRAVELMTESTQRNCSVPATGMLPAG